MPARRKPKLPNGNRAIMASRIEAPDSLDFYPTPLWATRALCELVLPHCIGFDSDWTAWEPACGEGHMSEVLKEYFSQVYASDVFDYGRGYDVGSFIGNGPDVLETETADFIITNPPFKDSLEFTLHALGLAQVGVAMFIRTQWAIEGVERYERLFRGRAPTLFAPFVERVPLCKGKWDPDGSTATAYCWCVWIHGRDPLPTFHIPPGQRKALTRPDDVARFAAWTMQEAAE